MPGARYADEHSHVNHFCEIRRNARRCFDLHGCVLVERSTTGRPCSRGLPGASPAGAIGVSDGEISLLAVLMLRGPQTPGELKTRTERLHRFESTSAVEQALERLIDREYAVRLERRPGQKEERYAQLVGGGGDETTVEAPSVDRSLEERVARLEAEVAELRERLG